MRTLAGRGVLWPNGRYSLRWTTVKRRVWALNGISLISLINKVPPSARSIAQVAPSSLEKSSCSINSCGSEETLTETNLP